MTLRLGVVGTGAIGRDHMRRCAAVLPGCAIAAASDVDAATARRALDAVAPDARAFDDGHALIADSAVDAVLVTSWGSTHAEYVLAAIDAGKPVFCEKPLATTAGDCRRIMEAEARGGRRLLQVGFMRMFDAGYRQLHATIRSGTIGDVLMVHAAHRNARGPARFTTAMMVNDTLIHELDALRHLLDDEYVSAEILFPPRSPHAPDGLRDPQIALLETRRGIRIDVEIFVNARYGYDIRCEVVGTDGTASLPEPPTVAIRRDAKHERAVLTDWSERFVDAYDRELADFVDGARRNAVGGPSAWDGFAATIAADACVRSQEIGQRVTIDMPPRPEFYGA